MVQQFSHHVVEPPDFFNPFYLLVNDVSAKMRPIILRFYPTFYVLFPPSCFSFLFTSSRLFYTFPALFPPRPALFRLFTLAGPPHAPLALLRAPDSLLFSDIFPLLRTFTPPVSLLQRPFTLHSRFIFRSPPLIRHASFSALFFLRAQHVFPPAHFLSLAPPPPALPRSARSPLPIFYPLSLFLSTSLFSSFARLGIKKHYLSKRRALFLCSFPLPFPCRFSAPFTYLFHSPPFFLFSGPKSRACFSGEYPLGAPLLTKRRICSKIKKKKIDFIKESILL